MFSKNNVIQELFCHNLHVHWNLSRKISMRFVLLFPDLTCAVTRYSFVRLSTSSTTSVSTSFTAVSAFTSSTLRVLLLLQSLPLLLLVLLLLRILQFFISPLYVMLYVRKGFRLWSTSQSKVSMEATGYLLHETWKFGRHFLLAFFVFSFSYDEWTGSLCYFVLGS